MFSNHLRRQAAGTSRRALLGTIAAALLVVGVSGHATPPKKTEPTTGPPNPRVQMEVANRGKILIELYPAAAPKTVAHFIDLVNRKFYDGILFHRVIADFVAQTGDPKSKGMDGSKIRDIPDAEVASKYGLGGGGSGKTVPLEAKLPHEKGTLGLARSQDIDTGDSQFFFNLKANHTLDGGYCVFGKVLNGANVMQAIKQGDRITSLRVVKAHK